MSRDGSRQPSLKDVAARAGVSFQTAGKALSGGATVTDETRRRILDAARELGYVPNVAARSLRTNRTHAIGVVVGDLSDHVLARFLVGAESEAQQRGYALTIVSVDHGTAAGDRSLDLLRSRRVDGILAAAPQLERHQQLGAMLREDVPAVSLHSVVGGGVSLVGSDQVEVGRIATRHLVELGHRRIGMITGPATRRAAQSRGDGYARALDAARVPVDADLVVPADWSPDGGFEATRRLLRRAGAVTALFVHNDLMAIGALHALSDGGRAVPDDVAVVSCDDMPVAAHTLPPLTTVRLPFEETGAVAVRTLVTQIENDERSQDRVLLDLVLRCRASCGCDRPHRADLAQEA